MVWAFGVVRAWFYAAQGTLFASLFPTRVRCTGLSTVYQLSVSTPRASRPWCSLGWSRSTTADPGTRAPILR